MRLTRLGSRLSTFSMPDFWQQKVCTCVYICMTEREREREREREGKRGEKEGSSL